VPEIAPYFCPARRANLQFFQFIRGETIADVRQSFSSSELPVRITIFSQHIQRHSGPSRLPGKLEKKSFSIRVFGKDFRGQQFWSFIPERNTWFIESVGFEGRLPEKQNGSNKLSFMGYPPHANVNRSDLWL